jgi:hypothetical protein
LSLQDHRLQPFQRDVFALLVRNELGLRGEHRTGAEYPCNAKLTVYATSGSGDVKRLKGLAGCRLRIGNWRVIFIEDARSITVVAVGNRKEIYD